MKNLALLAMSTLNDPQYDQFNKQMQDQQDVAEGVFAAGLVFVLIMLAISVVAFVFWVWGIIDAAKTDDAAWAAVGQNKVLWIVLMVVLGALVTLVYVFWPRPQLKRASVTGYTGPPNQF